MIYTQYQKEILEQTYKEIISKVLRPVKRIAASDFADMLVIPKETRGRSSPKWKGRMWQRDVIDMMVSDQIQNFWWQKSARSGATKMLVWACFYWAVILRRNILAYFPDDDDRSDFIRKEYDPAVRDNSIVQHIFRSLNTTSALNSSSSKMLFGSMQQFFGGFSEANFRGKSPDVVIADEASAFEGNIGGGGALRNLMDTRVTESVMPKSIGMSSPKHTGCHISDGFDEADIKLHWHTPCPNCEHYQVIQCHGHGATTGLVYEYNPADIKATGATARFVCENCKEQFKQKEMLPAIEAGYWQTMDGQVWFDRDLGLLVDVNGPLAGRHYVGAHSNVLIVDSFPWPQYVRERVRAVRARDGGDHSKWDTFAQTRDGVPTDPTRAEESIAAADIVERAESYPEDGTLPEGIETVTTFTDVHKRRFEIMVVGWGADEESWLIEYHIIQGDVTKWAIWEDLHDWLKAAQYVREDGVALEPFLNGIDYGGHWTDNVIRFCKLFGIDKMVPIKGDLGVGKPCVRYPKKVNDDGVYLTMASQDTSKQIVQKRLNTEVKYDDDDYVVPHQPGVIHVPHHADHQRYSLFDLSLVREFLSEVRQVKGKTVSWIQRQKNEGFDCLVGNLNVIRICQTRYKGVKLGEDKTHATSKRENQSFLEGYRARLKRMKENM